MSDEHLHRFAQLPVVLRLMAGLEGAQADAVLVMRGRTPEAGVQVLGLTVKDEAALAALLHAAVEALGSAPRSRFDPTASAG